MKSVRVSVLVVLIAGLLAATACGSPPSGFAGNPAASPVRWDYKFSGKLDSDQDSIAAVLAMLDSEAKSDGSRLYLAEYKLVARNRVSALNDDKQFWYVTFGMDRKPDAEQGEKAYWQSAAWVVFKEGKVLPSSRHAGNATRILMDLRAAAAN